MPLVEMGVKEQLELGVEVVQVLVVELFYSLEILIPVRVHL